MNSVERVKEICKERGIPLSKLEKDLGFGNAYIARIKKGVFPADRLKKIAEYLGVSESYLLTGEEDTAEKGYYLSVETAEVAQEIFQNKELRALFDATRGASPESLRLASEILRAMNGKGSDSNDA